MKQTKGSFCSILEPEISDKNPRQKHSFQNTDPFLVFLSLLFSNRWPLRIAVWRHSCNQPASTRFRSTGHIDSGFWRPTGDFCLRSRFRLWSNRCSPGFWSRHRNFCLWRLRLWQYSGIWCGDNHNCGHGFGRRRFRRIWSSSGNKSGRSVRRSSD